ncbi:hypothetical protein F4782DRAFT_530099 [Xylaria castorea]|nr:hypothetical protein F4782DRAFT_530099 [Xylaria castorea]
MSSENKSDDLLNDLLALYGNKTIEHGLDLMRRDKFIQSLEDSSLCQHGKHYSKVENGYPVIDDKPVRDGTMDLGHAPSTHLLEDLLVEMRKDGFIYPPGTYHYDDATWKVDLNCKAYKDAKKNAVTLDQLKKIFDSLERQGLAPPFEELERDEQGNFTLAANFDRAAQLAKFKMHELLEEGPIVARAVEFLHMAIEPLPSAFSVVLNRPSSNVKGKAITRSSCRSPIRDLLVTLNTVAPLVQCLFETLKRTVSNGKVTTLDTESALKIKETMEILFSEADLQAYLHPTTLDEEVKCLSSSMYCSMVILAQWLRPIWRYVLAAHVVVLTCAEFIGTEGLGDLTSYYFASLEIHELVVSLYQAMSSSARKSIRGNFSKPPRYHAELVREKINGVEGCLLDVISIHYNKRMVVDKSHVEWVVKRVGKSYNANSNGIAIVSIGQK